MDRPATLFDKIWSAHAILTRPDGAALLAIDRHLIHDGSGNAFRTLEERGLAVRRPDRTFATPDHYVATTAGTLAAISEPYRRQLVEGLQANARRAGLTLFELGDCGTIVHHPTSGIIGAAAAAARAFASTVRPAPTRPGAFYTWRNSSSRLAKHNIRSGVNGFTCDFCEVA